MNSLLSERAPSCMFHDSARPRLFSFYLARDVFYFLFFLCSNVVLVPRASTLIVSATKDTVHWFELTPFCIAHPIFSDIAPTLQLHTSVVTTSHNDFVYCFTLTSHGPRFPPLLGEASVLSICNFLVASAVPGALTFGLATLIVPTAAID